jgi:cytochrome c-type biogenesis protein CcmH/NrfF
LWITPFAVLVIGAGVAALAWQRRRPAGPSPLSAAEEEALRRLTSGEG